MLTRIIKEKTVLFTMVHQTELIICVHTYSNIKWRGLKMNNPAQHTVLISFRFLSCLYEHVK